MCEVYGLMYELVQMILACQDEGWTQQSLLSLTQSQRFGWLADTWQDWKRHTHYCMLAITLQ